MFNSGIKRKYVEENQAEAEEVSKKKNNKIQKHETP